MAGTRKQVLEGWGRVPRVASECARPESRRDMKRAIAERAGRPVLARGMGRAYGDAALISDGVMLLTERLDRILGFDDATGWLRVEAGVSLDEIIRVFLPRGFFPPVVPGTRYVSVGGALASDIHGKNHHVAGAWSTHVRNVELLKSTSEVVVCDAGNDPDLFRATAGGQGLTGVILSMEVRLRRVESNVVEMESTRVRNLDEFFEASEASRGWPYTVAWIDGLAKGASLGRGIFMAGRHAPAGAKRGRGLPGILPRRLRSGRFLQANFLLNGLTARAFNAAYYRKQLRRRVRVHTGVPGFFFPLDGVSRWNLLYGRRGFYQYQYVVPPDLDRRALRQTLEEISKSGMLPFLGVIKEFGPERHGWLSFPAPGVTVALDFPNRGERTLSLFKRLDDIVADAGGRVYLTKDARLGRAVFRRMYPEWELWKIVRDRADPDGVFHSGLSRRLGLTEG